MGKKLTTEDFINKAKKVHGDKYDYSSVNYINTSTKVKIKCKIHDIFEQQPSNHLQGNGCPKCSDMNIEYLTYIKAKEVLKPLVLNSKTEYLTYVSKTGINLPKSPEQVYKKTNDWISLGDFLGTNRIANQNIEWPSLTNATLIIQKYNLKNRKEYHKLIKKGKVKLPANPAKTYKNDGWTNWHDYLGVKSDKELFYEKLNKLQLDNIKIIDEYVNFKTPMKVVDENGFGHSIMPRTLLEGKGQLGIKTVIDKDKYFQTLSNKIHNNKFLYPEKYKNWKSIKVICPIHSKFKIRPSSHIQGVGCKKCANDALKMSKEEFIKRAREVHGNDFNYPFKNKDYKNCDTKIEIECKKCGNIFEQTPYSHLQGCGCPFCNASKGELKIKNFLDDLNIKYEIEKTFKKCKHKQKLQFDFYLPKYNICIEYDGIQHFKFIEFIHKTEENFKESLIKDNIKNKYCKNNNIYLLRIPYTEFDNIEKIIMNSINEYENK